MKERILQFALIALGALPVWLLLRKPWRRRPLREIVMGVFILFMTALLVMALEGLWTSPVDMIQRAAERIKSRTKLHLTPFMTIRQQMATLSTIESVVQLLGNTLLFIPWGFFLPLLWKRYRHFFRMAGMCLLLTCGIEFIQLFIDRTVDVDDLILNFAGSMVGAGLWWCVHRLFPRTDLLLDPPHDPQRS